jgi:CRP-like cAMP-binding protein
MDLLERARALAGCSLFADLAPATVVRLAERALARELAAGERCTTDDNVWVVADGGLAVTMHGAQAGETAQISTFRRTGSSAGPGGALGAIRVVAPATPPVIAVAAQPSRIVGFPLDDLRDILEEDPVALAALAEALARLLLDEHAR